MVGRSQLSRPRWREGRKDGHFPVDDIQAWLDARDNKLPQANPDGTPSTRDELQQIQLQTAQLKLSKQLGQVADVELMVREIIRGHTLAIQLLRPIADMVLQVLPPDTPPEVINDLRQRINTVLDNAMDQMGHKLVEQVNDLALDE